MSQNGQIIVPYGTFGIIVHRTEGKIIEQNTLIIVHLATLIMGNVPLRTKSLKDYVFFKSVSHFYGGATQNPWCVLL